MGTDNTETVEVRLILQVRPMTAEERKDAGDEFWDEDEDGAVDAAAFDMAEGIAGLLDWEEYAAEVFAGSGHFVKIESARADLAQVLPEGVRA